MADGGKINSEIGWQSLTHAWAKTMPRTLTHTGRVRKSLRTLTQKMR